MNSLTVSAVYRDKDKIGRDGVNYADWLVSVIVDQYAYTVRFASEDDAKAFREMNPYQIISEVTL